jgi:uncharacterized protein
MDRSASERTVKFIKNELTKNKSKGCILILYGGEPFLNKKACYYIVKAISDWAKKKGRFFFPMACTNGTLLTEEIVDFIEENTIKNLKAEIWQDVLWQYVLTLDGPKRIHDKLKKYKGGKGSYDDIINNLRMLQRKESPFIIKINVYGRYHKYMKELLDSLIDQGFKNSYLSFSPMISVYSSIVGIPPFPDVPPSKMVELVEYAVKKGFKIFLESVMSPLTFANYCVTITDRSYVIDPYGEIYKCWVLMGQKKYRLGTLDNNGCIKNLHYPLQRDVFKIEKCRKCTYLPLCGGNCMALSYLKTGKDQSSICPSKEWLDCYIKVRASQKYPGMIQV